MGVNKGKHLFVVATLGLGLAIAMVMDGLYGHSPVVTGNTIELTEESGVSETASSLEEGREEGTVGDNETTQDRPNYAELFKKKKEREEKRKIKRANEKAQREAYTGDGSRSSRRLYLIQQAYKASRDLTPIIPYVKDENDY
jgi:hypothetical protein